MKDHENTYIRTGAYARLRQTAEEGVVAHLELRRPGGGIRAVQARIAGFCARDGLEYLTTSDGSRIRLDQLYAVDGERLRNGRM